ncbi:MAG TPA: hypothetical protein VFI09_10160 [Solirubrobacterales bacterium]|nr:hypothetical protein [Solirubrobacterales bacterium]
MSRPGGPAGKDGLRYEDRWTAYCALQVLAGEARAIRLEDHRDAEEGFEFTLEAESEESHQVKRQLTGVGHWTLKALSQAGVLGAFFTRLQDPDAECVFASGHSADVLEELCSRGREVKTLDEFTRAIADNKTWKGHFEDLCELWAAEEDWAWKALRRVRVATINEEELKRALRVGAEYRMKGPVGLEPAALIEVLRDRVGHRLEAADLWAALAPLGYTPNREIGGTEGSREIHRLNERFVASRRRTLIGGTLLPRPETDEIEEALTGHRVVFVQGAAGTGKSDVILALCERLAERGETYLSFRLDREAAVTTATELGEGLGLGVSPAAALLAQAGNEERPVYLIIDQLDALSTTSGRHPEYLRSVAETIELALVDKRVKVILACRTFDAENDSRLRTIAKAAGEEQQIVVDIGLLPMHTVEGVLARLKLSAQKLSGTILQALRQPLQLSLLEAIAARHEVKAEELRTTHDLDEAFWNRKREELEQSLGQGAHWLEVIDRLVGYMSEEQQLIAPKAIVDDWPAEVREMASIGVLVEDGPNLAFFHERFFDYAFARRFVARKDTLGELLARDQFLFRRAQVRQILEYARRTPGKLYRESLDLLLKDEATRYHLIELVLSWIGALPDPGETEWEVLKPIIEDPEDLAHRGAWQALTSSAWFHFLDERGLVERWLDDEDTVERASWILLAASEREPGRLAEILRERLGRSAEWRGRVKAILSRCPDVGASRDLFEVAVQLFEQPDFEGDPLWFSVHELAEQHPEWASELLGRYLQGRIEAARAAGAADPFESGIVPRDTHPAEYIAAASQRAPRVFVEQIFPRFIELAEMASSPPVDREDAEERMTSDSIWHLRHFSDVDGELPEQLLHGLETAIAEVANEDAAFFSELVRGLKETELESVAYILFQGFAGNPDALADEAIEFVLADRRRLRVGHSDGYHWGTRRLLEAVSPAAGDESIAELEEAVIGYTTFWERTASGQKARGQAEFALLGGIAAERRSNHAAQRFAELQRKFGAEDAEGPMGIVGGWVGPPISDEAATKMSDDNWLKAIIEYDGDDFELRRDFMVGGARQLSTVFENRTKEDPTRFARLITRIPDEANIAYFDAILRGLGQSEKDFPLEAAVGAVERCHALPGHPCGMWIADPLRPFAEDRVPDAALEILSWYATEGDGASTVDPGANRKNAEIVATRGLNSVRGSAARAIGRLVDGNREHIPVLEPAIRSLVTDPEPPVRALAIEIPLWMLRHDEDLALELFEEGVADGDEDVLDSRGVSEFLRYRGRRYFDRLLPLIERMLASKSEDVQRNGAVQATLIALGEPEARELVEQCMDGPTAQRRGVARVCAANVADPSHREYCEGFLITLFDDPDEDVRNDAVVAIREMRKGGAERNTRLIERLLASRAFGDDLRAPVMAIKEADAPPPQLALEVAEKTLERLEAPGDIARREAMVARDLVDVVIRVYVDARERRTKDAALDIFDKTLSSDAYGARRALEAFDRG